MICPFRMLSVRGKCGFFVGTVFVPALLVGFWSTYFNGNELSASGLDAILRSVQEQNLFGTAMAALFLFAASAPVEFLFRPDIVLRCKRRTRWGVLLCGNMAVFCLAFALMQVLTLFLSAQICMPVLSNWKEAGSYFEQAAGTPWRGISASVCVFLVVTVDRLLLYLLFSEILVVCKIVSGKAAIGVIVGISLSVISVYWDREATFPLYFDFLRHAQPEYLSFSGILMDWVVSCVINGLLSVSILALFKRQDIF